MSILEKLKKEYSTIGLFFATILIIPFQTLLFIRASMQSLDILENTTINLFPESTIILLVYLILPIVYCIIVSLLFHPKRLVSPINVQIGTFVIFSIIIIFYVYTSITMSDIVFQNLIVSLFALGIIAILIGSLQLIIVRWVVGLNFDNIYRTSYLINRNLSDVMKILNDNFLNVWGFSRRKDNPQAKSPIWVLKSRNIDNNHVIIAIRQKEDKKSILAITAFHKSNLGIFKTENASARCNSIINDIKGRLMESDSSISIKHIDETDDYASIKAHEHSLAVTRSKIEIIQSFFKNIPRYYRWAITFTVFALFIISLACYWKFLNFNTYIGIAILIIITLFIEVGISLREELSRQNIEELD